MYNSQIMTEYYGYLSWTLILHIFLPFSVYFRFHSAVCLSQIWSEAYAPTMIENQFMEEAIAESETTIL